MPDATELTAVLNSRRPSRVSQSGSRRKRGREHTERRVLSADTRAIKLRSVFITVNSIFRGTSCKTPPSPTRTLTCPHTKRKRPVHADANSYRSRLFWQHSNIAAMPPSCALRYSLAGMTSRLE
jgi:hypothetical protein